MLELGELLVGEDGGLELDEPGVLGRGLEQVALRADGRLGRGDDLLADAVNRRIGHLGEELLEVAGERLRLVGQHRQRGVGAHRADGLGAVAGHGQHQEAQVLEGVAEGKLALKHGLVVRLGQNARVGHVRQPDQILVQPFAIRLGRGDLCLISSSATMRPCSISTRNMRPG